MGNRYTHLQTEDRVLIYELLYSGWAIAEIADVLNVNTDLSGNIRSFIAI